MAKCFWGCADLGGSVLYGSRRIKRRFDGSASETEVHILIYFTWTVFSSHSRRDSVEC